MQNEKGPHEIKAHGLYYTCPQTVHTICVCVSIHTHAHAVSSLAFDPSFPLRNNYRLCRDENLSSDYTCLSLHLWRAETASLPEFIVQSASLGAKIQTQVLMLTQPVLDPLGHVSSPSSPTQTALILAGIISTSSSSSSGGPRHPADWTQTGLCVGR